jgi:XTP/dITP diphosphohydrolase
VTRTMSLTLVLATANPDKAAEVAVVLGDAGIELLPRPADVDDVDETGDTLLANARLKAQAVADATNLPAVADDTGLEVDALGGAPGVYSARYAGDDVTYADNVAKLLTDLAALDDGGEIWAEGTVDGRIAAFPKGTGGFGYDAVFVPDDGDGRTFAEMPPDEKNAISHRGRAFRSLAGELAGRA